MTDRDVIADLQARLRGAEERITELERQVDVEANWSQLLHGRIKWLEEHAMTKQLPKEETSAK